MNTTIGRRIDFKTFDSGIIEMSEQVTDSYSRTLEEYTKQLIDTKEQGIKNSLKQIGWLSPEEVGKVRDLLERYLLESRFVYGEDYDEIEEFIEEYL